MLRYRAVALLTDFGTRDGFTAIMEGILRYEGQIPAILHLTHEISPQDILEAAFLLQMQLPYLPWGTLVVVVVDPGVGTDRRILYVEVQDLAGEGCGHGRHIGILAPDNGVLDLVADRYSLRWFTVHWDRVIRQPPSSTFHGRDVFAPVAWRLFWGQTWFVEPCGVPARRLPHRIIKVEPGMPSNRVSVPVLYHDRFGNAITGLWFAASWISHLRAVYVHGRALPVVRTYGQLKRGEAGALVNSEGFLEIAVREGNAREAGFHRFLRVDVRLDSGNKEMGAVP